MAGLSGAVWCCQPVPAVYCCAGLQPQMPLSLVGLSTRAHSSVRNARYKGSRLPSWPTSTALTWQCAVPSKCVFAPGPGLASVHSPSHGPARGHLRRGCGADHVYQEVKPRARAGILANMEREREGDQIDRALLKNTLEIFQEVTPRAAPAQRQGWASACSVSHAQGCVAPAPWHGVVPGWDRVPTGPSPRRSKRQRLCRWA